MMGITNATGRIFIAARNIKALLADWRVNHSRTFKTGGRAPLPAAVNIFHPHEKGEA